MESADTGRDDYGERVATELARLREAVDEIRRRPVPDVDTLRHVISASLSEASAPPPNLLVTAIRRLDRVDARLEAIEAAVSSQAALPAGGAANRGGRGGPVTAAPAPAPPSRPLGTVAGPAVDAEALGDVLARRLGPLISSAPPGRSGGGPTVDDLLAALRPLLPGAARTVLRRGGREPSAQAVDVLQQAAMAALDEAAASLGPITAQASPTPSPWAPRPIPAPAPVALPPPAPPPPAPPPPPPLDVEALASTIAARVTASVTESVARQLTEPEPAAPPPPPAAPATPSEPREGASAFDPAAVADLVAARLAEQPPPQAVVPALAMIPLVTAVGNVEAAVARLTEPDEDVVGAVARLEAGVEALARALEDDRAAQADELRRAFEGVTELVRDQQGAGATSSAAAQPGDGGRPRALRRAPEADHDPVLAAVLDLREQLDRMTQLVAPLAQVDLATTVPSIERRGQRLERSIGHILTALAAVADHLSEQASLWRGGADDQSTTTTDGATGQVEPDTPDVAAPADWPHDAGAAPAALAEVLTHEAGEVAPDPAAAGPAGPLAEEGSGGGSQADPGLAGVVEAAGSLADEDDPGGGSPPAVAVSPDPTDEDDRGGGSPAVVAVSATATDGGHPGGALQAAVAVSPDRTDADDSAGVSLAGVAVSHGGSEEDDAGQGSPAGTGEDDARRWPAAGVAVSPDRIDDNAGQRSPAGVAVSPDGADEDDAGQGSPTAVAGAPAGTDEEDGGQGSRDGVAGAPGEPDDDAPARGLQAEPAVVGVVAASGGDEEPEGAGGEPAGASQAEPGLVGVVAASGGDEEPEGAGGEPVESQAEPGLGGVVAASGGEEEPEGAGGGPVESQAEPGLAGEVAASGGDERAKDAGGEPVEAVAGLPDADGRDGGGDDDAVDPAAGPGDAGDDGADTEVVGTEATVRRRSRPKSKRRRSKRR